MIHVSNAYRQGYGPPKGPLVECQDFFFYFDVLLVETKHMLRLFPNKMKQQRLDVNQD